ncbi:MAG: phosphate ABC transporter substrate-binding protein [Burkholderiales bacterium RIFOXYC2_FULL_59_8]|nr:MAG: phosphate ABC transporter substrate-binding protein [Burkholderiales bacterium RIFOXYC2_FULL_59_8]OGB58959.1 MAG: phosphate ABC transporter substrate-binding protein [Burkholderiales bacterium RIFOXYD12_FULL_59_19]OGB77008.1 MAG: phosphate ABC transporter substrate-binding protein [Burkholderiales bacterium RIFOXYC12_FULL_60_6]OGB81146.1 MAG: phosphate ABC transporter substrate-binding protein [Burkholderiales bacterium RIFOXYD2_FULL_59_8]
MRRTLPSMNRAGFIIIGLALCLVAAEAVADVVAVVSAKNPVTTLSKSQVVDIFLGKTSRFPDGSQAVPIDQVEGSAARDEFYLKFSDKSPAQIKAHWSKIIFTGRGQPPRAVSNSIEMKKFLNENPNAIGYIEQSAVDGSVKVLLSQ